jgi:pimeloyl-ACP methyl ester carboxylesterase
MLHGLASSSHIFDFLAPRLAPAHRVAAYDQRGHGESAKPRAGYGFDETAADCLAVVRSLRLRRPVLLGHSWGANVALEAAVRAPGSVAGLVLVDGGFMTMRDRMTWSEARELLAPPPLSHLTAKQFLALARREFAKELRWGLALDAAFLSYLTVGRSGRIRPRLSRANHMRILRAMYGQDPLALLRRVRVPTLVLAASASASDEREWVAAKRRVAPFVRAIGPRVRFEWIHAIHDVPLQSPRALASRIRAFLRTL